MKDARGHGSAAHQTKLGRILAKRRTDEMKAGVRVRSAIEGLKKNPQGSAGYSKAYDDYRKAMTIKQSFGPTY